MDEVLNFTIPGIPQSKKRPRFSRFKGKVRTYDSQSEEKETARWQLKSRMVGKELFKDCIEVSLKFFLPIPKSTSKKVKKLMSTDNIPHIKKPDIDNFCKAILDYMNGIVYVDDSQIYKLTAIKLYSENPRTEIVIK